VVEVLTESSSAVRAAPAARRPSIGSRFEEIGSRPRVRCLHHEVVISLCNRNLLQVLVSGLDIKILAPWKTNLG